MELNCAKILLRLSAIFYTSLVPYGSSICLLGSVMHSDWLKCQIHFPKKKKKPGVRMISHNYMIHS